MSKENIFPVFDKLVDRTAKEIALNQYACVLWLTGLSGSGKTTIASALERRLFDMGYHSQVLDGDNVRTGLCNNLGFDESDRLENIRRIAEVARLFVNSGIITICCFVSPTNSIRDLAKNIIGENDFKEVYIKASLELCEQRDVKGLYKKARLGEIADFTGISAPFEEPVKPFIIVDTGNENVEQCVTGVLNNILSIIKR